MRADPPQLMTPREEAEASRFPDKNLFATGLPAVISENLKRTWAEPYLLLSRLTGKRAEALLELMARGHGFCEYSYEAE